MLNSALTLTILRQDIELAVDRAIVRAGFAFPSLQSIVKIGAAA